MKVLVTQLCPTLCDPGTVAHQAPLSMEFSSQEYCSGQPFPSPGDHPNPGIEPVSPALQTDSLPSEPPGKPKYKWYATATAKSLQSCLTLCDPIPGILQARTLEWVAISFSNAEKWKVKVKLLGHVRLFATPWTAAYQVPPSMGFFRQEYWSGCHCLLW